MPKEDEETEKSSKVGRSICYTHAVHSLTHNMRHDLMSVHSCHVSLSHTRNPPTHRGRGRWKDTIKGLNPHKGVGRIQNGVLTVNKGRESRMKRT